MGFHILKPALMGLMMGAMMLWMMHGWLIGDGPANALVFVLGHVAVVAAVALTAALGLHRRFPVLARLTRHRPSLSHIAIMLGSAALFALAIHLVHGAPTWI
ncbi:hypothetical protein [Marivita sp. XM-24bin2]|jgi:hypothetical protein|uniref:hypothetical protein n=1 Tax=unclassified Marivita TaxID=2632480 RepID=UPI000D791C8B|nr:hypothetical protein [Marivita sp. XM-24bin2]MCR9110650.1 hypothetical protein [Paracoccaceae bacterium]PWL34003.1 MAG: hypothetical protein DCO97_16520 [Marivita sp. XM-24bin2]